MSRYRDTEHAYRLIDTDNLTLLRDMIAHGRYPISDMAIYAARLGREDICFYLIGLIDDVDTIYKCMYEARINGHYGLYLQLGKIAINATV